MDPQRSGPILETLESTGLVSADVVSELRETMSVDPSATDQSLVEQLTQRQMLTDYQAEQLLAGHGTELKLAERYTIERPLGSGGMGEVYLADDAQLGRQVAIKVLPKGRVNDVDAVARFHREAQALARMSHAAIVQAYDFGEDGGRVYLVMEYVEGESLRDRILRKGPLPAGLAADFIYQAAGGLAYAHHRGLVHRDMKPSNLLATEERRIKILDLGLARFMQDQLADGTITLEGVGLGTPDFMAPEQFADARRADARSDIYSLGCTLFNLLAGRVPFPGSSLIEKRRSHETGDVPAVGQLREDVPAGLEIVTRRMMAKRPDDRFASAQEVADALLPYVPSSSGSLPDLGATTSWDGSQLVVGSHPRRRRLIVAASLCVAVIGVLLAVSSMLVDWRAGAGKESGSGSGNRVTASGVSGSGGTRGGTAIAGNVLTVAQDGTGQFTTINAALAEARPGMTIRVVDDGVYAEEITLTNARLHAGLTLEATAGATIQPPEGSSWAVQILDVDHVTVRGFHLRATIDGLYLVLVAKNAAGAVLDGLDMSTDNPGLYVGLDVEYLALAPEDEPVIIRNCRVKDAGMGVRVSGCANDFKSPLPASNLVVYDNLFVNCEDAVILHGEIHRMCIVGNRAVGASLAGVQLGPLLAASDDILVANNTFLSCSGSFRVWDEALHGERISVCNNVILDPAGPDMIFVDSGGSIETPKGPGDVKQLLAQWSLHDNWREADQPAGNDLFAQSWIPAADGDKLGETVEVASRTPEDESFLQPVQGSPVAATGAIDSDWLLPPFAGAVCAADQMAWDWQKTWNAKFKDVLLVSQEPKDKCDARSIGEAIRMAWPGAIIRILDDAQYAEQVTIDDPLTQRDLRIESPKHATLLLNAVTSIGLQINGVPGVHVVGLRLEGRVPEHSIGGIMAVVRGVADGVQFEDVGFQANALVSALQLQGVTSKSSDATIAIRRCTFDVGADGVLVIGPSDESSNGADFRIEDNRFARALRGITISKHVGRVQVTGNVLCHCSQAGIQLFDLLESSGAVLVANNTCRDCVVGIRVWDDEPYEDLGTWNVTIARNLLWECTMADIAGIKSSSGPDPKSSPIDTEAILKSWTFQDNFRDMLSQAETYRIPLAPSDHGLEQISFVSEDILSPDFLRPKDAATVKPLKKGAVALPSYAGALPPPGMEAWDWNQTWDSVWDRPPAPQGGKQ